MSSKTEAAVNAAIAAAEKCGIIVTVSEGTDEDEFSRASAHFANDPTGKPATCLRIDPVRAIQSAIDALTKKDPGTTLQ
jgi:hypothetical protein